MTSRLFSASTLLLLAASGETFVANSVRADDAPPDNLETIVVTASRIPQDAQTVGSSVSVITEDEIAKFQDRFVLDALTTTAGLDAAQSGGPGGTASVFLRGADSYQTMVLIDGVPVNDPSGPESAFDFGRLLATDIQRIEVLRGPQSTLYGGDAVGGVINIITKQGQQGLNASGLAEGGSYGTGNFAANLSGGIENLTGYFNVSKFFTYGFPAADVRFGNHMNDGLETTAESAGGHLTATDWLAFDLALRAQDSEAGYPGTNFVTDLPADAPNEARTHERSGRLSATTSFFDGDLTGTLSFMDSITRRHTLDVDYGETDYDGEQRKAEYLLNGRLASWLTFVGGVDWLQNDAVTSYDMHHAVFTRSAFGEFQAQAIEHFYVTAGGRLDDNSAFGDFATYRVTAAYLVDATGTKLHAATGTGFRAPSLYELYDTYSGNPDLRPETSQSWEAGVEQKVIKGVVLKATYFDQSINHRIDFNPVTFVSFNSGRTTAQGLEFEADISPVKQFTARLVYTYDYTNDQATGEEALRRPRNSASVIAAWQATGNLDLTARVQVVGPRLDYGGVSLAGYVKGDIGAEYRLNQYVTLEARIQNIGDTRYEEVYGYGTAGRSAYGGVALKY